jgi:hypothetical protein
MNISAETKPSLEGSDRVLVTLAPTRAGIEAGVILIRLAAEYEHLVRAGTSPKPVVDEFAQIWGLHCAMAERLLKGQLSLRLEPNGVIAVFMNAQELLECYLARVGLAEGARPAIDDLDHWERPINAQGRRRRIEQALHLHARNESYGTCGFVGGEAQLTELLRDLRVWCDVQDVNLFRCLSRAFDWAV